MCAFTCTFKGDICSLDTYHLIIFAAHKQMPDKPAVLDVGLFLLLDLFYFSWFWSTPYCACSLVCVFVRMCVCLCVCILAELYGCAQTALCVNSSLAVGGGHTPVCVCVGVCVDWWGRSRVPGLLTTPPLPLFPPIALFHPRLIWQRRRRRAGARVTKGHCSSSNITLMPLFPLSRHLVSLLCPHLSLLPARSVPPPCSFVSVSTSPASLVSLTPRDRAYSLGDARHLVIFVWNSSALDCFFFVCFVFLSSAFELIWNLISYWERQ